jgi:hypothetical protein
MKGSSSSKIVMFLVVAAVAFIAYRYMAVKKRHEGFCNPDEVRVSGACRKTCLEGQYNPGEKNCY